MQNQTKEKSRAKTFHNSKTNNQKMRQLRQKQKIHQDIKLKSKAAK